LKFALFVSLIFSCNFCAAQLLEPPAEENLMTEYAWLFKANNNLKCGPSKTDIRDYASELDNFNGYYGDVIYIDAKGILIVSIIQGKEVFTKKLIVK